MFLQQKMEESRHLDDSLNHYMLLDLCSTSMKKYEILIQCCEKWIYLTQMPSLYFLYGTCKYVNVLFFTAIFQKCEHLYSLKSFKAMLSISAWICHQKKIQKKKFCDFFSFCLISDKWWLNKNGTHSFKIPFFVWT